MFDVQYSFQQANIYVFRQQQNGCCWPFLKLNLTHAFWDHFTQPKARLSDNLLCVFGFLTEIWCYFLSSSLGQHKRLKVWPTVWHPCHGQVGFFYMHSQAQISVKPLLSPRNALRRGYSNAAVVPSVRVSILYPHISTVCVTTCILKWMTWYRISQEWNQCYCQTQVGKIWEKLTKSMPRVCYILQDIPPPVYWRE